MEGLSSAEKRRYQTRAQTRAEHEIQRIRNSSPLPLSRVIRQNANDQGRGSSIQELTRSLYMSTREQGIHHPRPSYNSLPPAAAYTIASYRPMSQLPNAHSPHSQSPLPAAQLPENAHTTQLQHRQSESFRIHPTNPPRSQRPPQHSSSYPVESPAKDRVANTLQQASYGAGVENFSPAPTQDALYTPQAPLPRPIYQLFPPPTAYPVNVQFVAIATNPSIQPHIYLMCQMAHCITPETVDPNILGQAARAVHAYFAYDLSNPRMPLPVLVRSTGGPLQGAALQAILTPVPPPPSRYPTPPPVMYQDSGAVSTQGPTSNPQHLGNTAVPDSLNSNMMTGNFHSPAPTRVMPTPTDALIQQYNPSMVPLNHNQTQAAAAIQAYVPHAQYPAQQQQQQYLLPYGAHAQPGPPIYPNYSQAQTFPTQPLQQPQALIQPLFTRQDHGDTSDYGWGPGVRVHEDIRAVVGLFEQDALYREMSKEYDLHIARF